MKVTKETELHYDYFGDTRIKLNDKVCFYYEAHNSLDKYQILEYGTDKLVVCAENKNELIDYLIKEEAEILELK